jgi:hypothetical protein
MIPNGPTSPILAKIGRRFIFHPFVLFAGYGLIGAFK